MATLYVENVPDSLYKALKGQARRKRKSIAAEVIELLEQNIASPEELHERSDFARKMREFSSRQPLTPGPFPSTEEMIREDRER
jgi:plasmid stability protein